MMTNVLLFFSVSFLLIILHKSIRFKLSNLELSKKRNTMLNNLCFFYQKLIIN